jgi:hypothetical protein
MRNIWLRSLVCAVFLLGWGIPMAAQAAPPALPKPVLSQLGTALRLSGASVYRKFGFSIYEAALWCLPVGWAAAKPYALQLVYRRTLSRDTLVEGVMDGIRDQQVADEPTLARWQNLLQQALPAEVAAGEAIIGVSHPGQAATLFHNDKPIMHIKETALSQAFFNIWLGTTADAETRRQLLGQAE